MTRSLIERIEQAIARGGSIEAARRLMPGTPIRLIAAVWNQMQETVYPTDKPGPKPRAK